MIFSVQVANASHFKYAATICQMMEDAAKIRGTGIAKREPEYVREKMQEGKAIIALHEELVVGFCYIESWEDQKYVANSGLIVHPDYRQYGLAKRIKQATFRLSKEKFPNAKLFGITTSLAVMKINYDLGYRPVTFSELTQNEQFWKGCQSCKNFDILQRTERKMCLCTAMVCDLGQVPEPKKSQKQTAWHSLKKSVKNKTSKLSQSIFKKKSDE